MSSLSHAENTHWFRFLSRCALLTGLVYLSLMLAVILVILPVSQDSPLPGEYFELVAANRAPIFYRLTIGFDIAAWLALGSLLIAFAALFIRHAPVRSTFIAALGVGMVSGFVGACFRLTGTIDLAAQYWTAMPDQQAILLQSYSDLLRVINILFSAGGFIGETALLLVVSIIWSQAEFPRWVTVLIGLSGLLGISKAIIELATGADLGPLALFGNILLIIALFAITKIFWSRRSIPRQEGIV